MLLLWLALALGLAQAVAIRHGYSHNPGEITTQSAGKHPGGLAHCHSCIAAVAVGGAAPHSPTVLLLASGQQSPHPVAATVAHIAPQQRPYAIRAPPAISS